MAGLVFGRTKKIMATLNALLVPLHDPIRLAEDIAVLDLASGGRFVVTAGIGYRPSEYEAHGKDWATRGALQDEAIDTMLKAWTGEPFEYRGTTVQVTPAAVHPAASRAHARRVEQGGGAARGALRAALHAAGEPARARGLLLRAVRRVRHPGLLCHAAASTPR